MDVVSTQNIYSPIIHIWADGSCYPNPGPGGAACILRVELPNGQVRTRKIYRHEPEKTTNNRQELQAVIEALKALKRKSEVVFHLDSEYVGKGITEYMPAWKLRGWKKSDKKPPINLDMWQELDALLIEKTTRVEFEWQRGHQGEANNEWCDAQAALAARTQTSLDVTETA